MTAGRFIAGLVAGWLCTATVFAGDCQLTGSVCVDLTPSKNISGITVTLAQAGGCWEYTDTYRCIKPDAIDYCGPLTTDAACQLNGISCIARDFNGNCMTQESLYQCNDPGLATPANTIRLADSYTLVQNIADACTAQETNPNCQVAAKTCPDPTPCRPDPTGATVCLQGAAGPAGALYINDTCWNWQYQYSCIIPYNDCQALIDKGCTLQSKTCELYDKLGACTLYDDTYSCISQPATSKTVMDCTSSTCMNLNQSAQCFQTASGPDPNYLAAVAAMEAARQAGTYFDGTLFSGKGEDCTKGLLGLKNCCKTSGGAQTNQQLSPSIGIGPSVVSIGMAGASYMKYLASPYMYDFMYQNGWTSQALKGLSDFGAQYSVMGNSVIETDGGIALTGDTSFMTGGVPVGYGLSIGYGVAPETAIWAAADSGSSLFISFDPYSFAIAVAIQVLQNLMACTQDEQLLGLHRGANLCQSVGSYCSQELDLIFTKICIETTEAYCCFNSKLARIIQQQGRAQIGKGWGSPQSPDCSGFSTDQFASLDFSKMDLSEFFASVNLPSVDASAVATTGAARAQTLIQQRTGQ